MHILVGGIWYVHILTCINSKECIHTQPISDAKGHNGQLITQNNNIYTSAVAWFAFANGVIYLLSPREQLRINLVSTSFHDYKSFIDTARLDIAPYQRPMSPKLVLSWGRMVQLSRALMILQP